MNTLSAHDACERLKISRSTLRGLVKKGRIATVRRDGRTFDVIIDSLEEYDRQRKAKKNRWHKP